MSESLANIFIGIGGALIAILTLLQNFELFLISGARELEELGRLMGKNYTQGEANKIIKDNNSRIKNIYASLIFIGAIMMAIGGFFK
jgi:hypothetical protein